MSDTSNISIHLNGRDREVTAGHTVRTLIESLDLHPSLVVVEYNREILERDRYGTVSVQAGDRVELVHFVGGG
ncbi:MAG: sulfur carrier protein ThiS [Gemmatimonadota bacterium]|nr:sulfur carrier protein ThiS [Gemmatimonadota bacterium]MDH5759575.1 sulfur carrier protein ThiS [Gemmatimonadota bacterium]